LDLGFIIIYLRQVKFNKNNVIVNVKYCVGFIKSTEFPNLLIALLPDFLIS